MATSPVERKAKLSIKKREEDGGGEYDRNERRDLHGMESNGGGGGGAVDGCAARFTAGESLQLGWGLLVFGEWTCVLELGAGELGLLPLAFGIKCF